MEGEIEAEMKAEMAAEMEAHQVVAPSVVRKYKVEQVCAAAEMDGRRVLCRSRAARGDELDAIDGE